MDPSTVMAITSISAISLGIITKLLMVLRKNVKTCCFISFRSPTNSVKDKNETTDIEMTNHNHNHTNEHHTVSEPVYNIQITPEVLNQIQTSGRNLV